MAPSFEYLVPHSCNLSPERVHGMKVPRNRLVVGMASDHGPQPFALFLDPLMHPFPQLDLYLVKLSSHSLPYRFPFHLKPTLPGQAAHECKCVPLVGGRDFKRLATYP